MFGENDRRRLALAVVLALALHELFAAFFPAPVHETGETIHVAQVIRIEKRPKPTPTPTPVPTSTPTPEPVRTTPNPAPPRARASAGPAANIAHTHYHKKVIESLPIWDKVGGAGASKHGTGSGANGTGGNGAGTGGSGNGVAGPGEPCGFVEFEPTEANRYDRATGGFYETLKMTVHYGDGGSEAINLDWPFYFPSDAADPWSTENLEHPERMPDFPFQFPPRSKVPNEPPVVQYVITHSTPAGLTILRDCPGTRG